MALSLEAKALKKSLTIGDDYAKENVIEITITITASGPVWPRLRIPFGENAVLGDPVDANTIVIATPGTHPDPEVRAAETAFKEWTLGDSDHGVTINGTATLSVVISNVLCRASDGKSNLTITALTGETPPETKTADVEITKAKPTKAQENPILYFMADPTSLIGRGEVTLKWAVVDGWNVSLDGPLGNISIAPKASRQAIEAAASNSYTLRARRPGDKFDSFSKQVSVNVLTGGWHELYPLGRSAPADLDKRGPFPSVIFDPCSRRADDLYAIFVRETGAGRQAVLCKSANGVTNWQVIREDIPADMESSPGILLEDRLWLIGGSTVDPDVISNKIWYYDLKAPAKGWQEPDVTGFENGARMGHACLAVADKTIWVMGGLDRYRTCVSDVWILTIESQPGGIPKVTAAQKSASWPPRCMFSAFAYKDDTMTTDMFWVLGGVSSPNGNPVGGVYTSTGSPETWKKAVRVPDGLDSAIGTGGTATSLSTPRLVFRTQESLKDNTSYLTAVTETDTRWSDSTALSTFEINNHWNRWRSSNHSIAMVGFLGRLYLRFLHRNALHAKPVESPIFVHVSK